MDLTYGLLFVPTKATLYVDAGKPKFQRGNHHYLAFELTAPLWVDDIRSEVRIGKNRTLRDVRGVLMATSGEITEDEKLQGEKLPHIGHLGYNKAITSDDESHRESFFAQVWLSPSYFDELMHAARVGKVPRSFRVEVRGDGMKFGNDPDGSEKEWDVDKAPNLAIVALSFALPLAFEAAPAVIEEDNGKLPSPDALPPTRAQLMRLSELVAALKIPAWIAAIALVLIAYHFAR